MEINRNVSIVKDSKGKDIVLINDIQFKGKRKVDWNEVKEYLYGYVGDIYEISNTDDYVYIGTDMIRDLRFQSLQMMDELSVTICIMHLC